MHSLRSRQSQVAVYVEKAALKGMIDASAAYAPLETGGLLLGYSASPSEVVVTSLIYAGPKALHEKESFVPDHEFQELELARIYEASGRVWTYLGDWHSHPGGIPLLSRLDRETLFSIANSKDARVVVPLMAVVAGGPDWVLGIWSVDPTGARMESTIVPASISLDRGSTGR